MAGPEFLYRFNQGCLPYDESPGHALAKAPYQRIAQRGNSSDQIGARKPIEHTPQIPHSRLFEAQRKSAPVNYPQMKHAFSNREPRVN